MTQLNALFFCVVLPLWLAAIIINLWTLYKRNRTTEDLKRWGWYHFLHSISQVVTVILGLILGLLGSEVIRQW